jgi:hypothetical protein
MYLLSVNKAWTFTPELVKKKPEEVFKFMDADLLPDFRKKVIIDFLDNQILGKSLQDWEVDILLNEELNDTEKMYRVGRRYEEVIKLEKILKKRKRIQLYNREYYRNHKKFKHFKFR